MGEEVNVATSARRPPPGEKRLAQRDAFAAARAAFDDAARRLPHARFSRYVVLAGRTVQLEVVGRLLFERLHPALSHLEIAGDGAVPDLTIRVWDGAATGVAGPDARGQGDPGLNGTVEVSEDGRLVVHHRRTSTGWLDRDTCDLVAYFPDANRAALYDRSKPLQLLLAVWHLDRHVPLVHAGVVARDRRSVLFPGKGGSGKSTASLSCALSGFDYLGDDCVGLESRDGGTIHAHSVYCSTNLEPDHLERFPALKPHAIAGTTPDEDKNLVLLNHLLRAPLARTAALAAVAIPRLVPGHPTRLIAASRADALKALAPTTVLFFPGFGAKHLEFLAGVVAAVPCYWLEMSEDLTEIPACLDALLSA